MLCRDALHQVYFLYSVHSIIVLVATMHVGRGGLHFRLLKKQKLH
jgi:hypothetical protein